MDAGQKGDMLNETNKLANSLKVMKCFDVRMTTG